MRVLHWVLAPSFLILVASGLYIHKPSRVWGFRSMDSARKAHFIAQYFFGFYFLARAYYAVVTRDYRKIFPGVKDIIALPKFVAYELFLKKKKPKYPRYNPGQKLLYSQMALLFPLQIITGAVLYLTGKLQKLSRFFGGLNNVRLAHYLTTVGLSSMVAGHIYFALTDSVEKLKSIFTGYFKPK
ncbi:MAG: cytochrome b/b6 domain-containing protein [Peptococcaceae bacterium]|nr:cytochrome b/b6 domain-containing protein [Peptococcaceae bacterium]